MKQIINGNSLIWAGLIIGFGLVPVLMTSTYQLNVANYILIWALFAISFNMLWGITGMLSFGQALYFGIGGYAVGLGIHYLGSAWYLPALFLGLICSVILSSLLGLLVIRVGGVYFTMLTLAFGQLAWQIMFKWYEFTGGDDGVQGVILPGILANKVVYYYFVMILVLLSVWSLKRIAFSPFGLILRGIRQNPERIRFLGRRVRRNQLRVYVVSAFFASLAGALMAGVDNSVHTDMFFWTTSGEVILMTVLGGIHQFFGPFIGAACIIIIEDFVGAYTEYWSLIIGVIILFMVIVFPKGIGGGLADLIEKIIPKKQGASSNGTGTAADVG